MVTTLLIAINVLIFIYAQTHAQIIEKYILSEDKIRRHNQWYRLFTSWFLHSSPAHLLFNMYTLFSFGTYLEAKTSTLFLISVFAISIIFWWLFSLYLHWWDWGYKALWASGGVTWVIFACVLLLDSSVGLILIPVFIPGYLFALIFFFVSFLFWTRKSGNIAHNAHVGWALAGCIIAAVFYGYLFDIKSFLLYIFSAIAISIWIWHEKTIKDTLIFVAIFVSITISIGVLQNWNMNFIARGKNPSLSYYQSVDVTENEKNIFKNYIDDSEYLLLVKYSLSIEKMEKIKAITDFKQLSQERINELKKIFYQEEKGFVNIKWENKEITHLIWEKSDEWSEIVTCVKENKLPDCT